MGGDRVVGHVLVPDQLVVAEAAHAPAVDDDVRQDRDFRPGGIERCAAPPCRRHVEIAEVARERSQRIVIKLLAPETQHQVFVPGVLDHPEGPGIDRGGQVDTDHVGTERRAGGNDVNTVLHACPPFPVRIGLCVVRVAASSRSRPDH